MEFKKKLAVGIGLIAVMIIVAVAVFFATAPEHTPGNTREEFVAEDETTQENIGERAAETDISDTASGAASSTASGAASSTASGAASETVSDTELADAEESRPAFIMIQFENQIRETRADLHIFEGFSMYIPESWIMYDEYLTPPAELTLKGAGGEIWIECYEGEMLSQTEARFMEEGYSYDAEDGKWCKNEGTLVRRVQLEEKEGDVWALFRVYDEALINSYGIDVVADTCIFTGITGDRPAKTREEMILKDEYYGSAKYLYQMDWESVSAKISAEENETLRRFMSVLDGGAFTWIYVSVQDTDIHDKKEVTIRQMLAEQWEVHGLMEEEPIVDSFYFADVFQSGSEDMVLLLQNMGYEWLILHEEGGVIYGIDMPIRWFSRVYENGLYVGSSGAADHSYYKMKFVDGDYVNEKVARVYEGVLTIDGEKKSEAEYEAWKEENLKGLVQLYNPLGEIVE